MAAQRKLDGVAWIVLIILCFLGFTLGTVILKPSGVVQVSKGRTVRLVCILRNDTKPSFTAFPSFLGIGPHFKRMPSNANLTVDWLAPDTMVLEIPDFSKSDVGLYLCGSSLAGFETVTLILGGRYRACGRRMFPCKGRCIPQRFLCDHVDDCPDKSDERDCNVNCTSMFVCKNGQCINPALVCDDFNSKNCRDGSDELNCEISPTVRAHRVVEYDHGSWHFNIIYGVVAGFIGLICVVGIVLITICKIQLRRAIITRRMERHLANIRWQDNDIYYATAAAAAAAAAAGDDDTECFVHTPLAPPPPASDSLQQDPELVVPQGELVTPPSYSEVTQMEEQDKLQPPPYSAVDTTHEGQPVLSPPTTGPLAQPFQPPPSYTEILAEGNDLGQPRLLTHSPQTGPADSDVNIADTDTNQGVGH